MTDGLKPRYYKCEGEALSLLTKYRDELKALDVSRKKLEQAFVEDSQILMAQYETSLRVIWQNLTAMVGVPKGTWGSQEYRAEMNYLELGFGAVVRVPGPPLTGLTLDPPSDKRKIN